MESGQLRNQGVMRWIIEFQETQSVLHEKRIKKIGLQWPKESINPGLVQID